MLPSHSHHRLTSGAKNAGGPVDPGRSDNSRPRKRLHPRARALTRCAVAFHATRIAGCVPSPKDPRPDPPRAESGDVSPRGGPVSAQSAPVRAEGGAASDESSATTHINGPDGDRSAPSAGAISTVRAEVDDPVLADPGALRRPLPWRAPAPSAGRTPSAGTAGIAPARSRRTLRRRTSSVSIHGPHAGRPRPPGDTVEPCLNPCRGSSFSSSAGRICARCTPRATPRRVMRSSDDGRWRNRAPAVRRQPRSVPHRT
jgi:hypothetical protein